MCIRLGMRFALKGNGSSDAMVLAAAHDALMECETRFRQSGRYVFRADELVSVRAGLTAHDQQMHRTSYHTVSKLMMVMHVELKGEQHEYDKRRGT